MKNEPFVSFVVTTFNSEKYIERVLEAILRQEYPKNRLEILVIDDNSIDGTQEKVKKLQKKFKNLKLFIKPLRKKRSPAGSSNLGIRKTKGKLIASVDGDAVIFPDWLKKILKEFKDENVGIVSGLIYTANPRKIWAAFAGRELEDRLLRLKKKDVDSISPCNTVYRREVFDKVGLFDENFNYYAQDVDFCYRAREAGYRILVSSKTGCKHYWRESFLGWLRQAYGTGYGRLEVVAKFPQRKVGDPVSSWKLIFQVPLTLFLLIVLIFYLLFKLPILFFLSLSTGLILLAVQIPTTSRIIKRTRDSRFLLFPFALLVRNLTWAWAFLRYHIKRLGGLS